MASESAESGPGHCYISELYLIAPHILSDILFYCSPTTFDAMRYTCKAIYSMSLEPMLLDHHLTTIFERQEYLLNSSPPDSRDVKIAHTWDTGKKVKGNLWRTRGLLLTEFLRMQSSWRVGEYQKIVLDLDLREQDDGEYLDPPFDGTIRLSLGTVKGEVFLISWSDKEKANLHTYRFSTGQKSAIMLLESPKNMAMSHKRSSTEYLHSEYSATGVRSKPVKLLFKADKDFGININEGQYKEHPGTIGRTYQYGAYGRTNNWYHRYLGYGVIPKEQTCALLRLQFSAKDPRDQESDYGTVNMAFELEWKAKKAWNTIPVHIQSLPNVVLPDHSEESMSFKLSRDGKCQAEGYAIGIDDQRNIWSWKVIEGRRLEQDISRNGVWKYIDVDFSKLDGEEPALTLRGTVSKNLVNPESGKRFLLSNPKTMSPKDWLKIKINLVLPPTGYGEKHGKLVLASPTPSAYFRPLSMRDPDIPWPDPGFKMDGFIPKNEQVTTNVDTEDALGQLSLLDLEPEPPLVRTGCMLHSNMLDAEIVSRVVGWTDDGAVWVWDINEKHILDCGALVAPFVEGQEVPVGIMDLPAKKLGYVKDVRGIAVTGDRLAQRIFLLTYGKELEVHKGGKALSDNETNDSGISSLRREDILRGIAKSGYSSKQTRDWVEEEAEAAVTDDGEGEPASSEDDMEVGEEQEEEEEEDERDDRDRWRMITYSFGDQKGMAGGFRMDNTGQLETLW